MDAAPFRATCKQQQQQQQQYLLKHKDSSTAAFRDSAVAVGGSCSKGLKEEARYHT
jgi:hypothetical protein